MKVRDVKSYLEIYAPVKIQESYDNCGLIVGDEHMELTGVLTTLDVMEAVVDEAISKGFNMIVSHHPIVFFGLKKFSTNTYVERTILKAIKNDIAIYAMHTNLDKVYNGVNQKILSMLDIKNCSILKMEEAKGNPPGSPWGVAGHGMVGVLEKSEFIIDFLERVKKVFGCETIKHTCTNNKKIRTIAVCGGAGFSLLRDAMKAKADIFLTSDITYHQFFDADGKIVLADIGHYESEQFTKELLKEIVEESFIQSFRTNVIISKTHTNPVRYI